jgi:hypothetical protein
MKRQNALPGYLSRILKNLQQELLRKYLPLHLKYKKIYRCLPDPWYYYPGFYILRNSFIFFYQLAGIIQP